MTATNAARELLQVSDRHHLMLLYDDERERSVAEIASINHALADGCYCVYATVDADNNDFLTRLAILIKDYDRHVKEGNLRIVNFKPYYEFALKTDLHQFIELKGEVEVTLKNRAAQGKKEKALLVADAACNMSKHKQFEECVSLETWWQNTYNEWKANNLDITIICAHPLSMLENENRSQKSRIENQHSLTIDLCDFTTSNITESAKPLPEANRTNHLPLRVLVVEPEPDIRAVYYRYFKSLPVGVETVENGLDCFEKALMPRNKQTYDLIIIDTHIKDTSAVHVAKKLLEDNPNQQIIFSSTWNLSNFQSELESQSLDPARFSILQKPFQFSELLTLIKPARLTADS